MTPQDPQSAAEYEDRTTAAVKSVLIEIGQILGSFRGKFAVIGGAVPWLLLANEDMPHVGTLDVDLSLDAEALGDGEYATLIGALQGHGYAQREGLRRFQLVRQVFARDGGDAIDIVVDFLMPRDAEIVKNDPPLISDFAVQRADGADLAMRFNDLPVRNLLRSRPWWRRYRNGGGQEARRAASALHIAKVRSSIEDCARRLRWCAAIASWEAN